MKKSKLKKILDLFMNESDREALEELYKETKDPLVKILLDWNGQYEIEIQDYNTPQFYMYDDIMSYIFGKYKLRKI